MKLVVLSSNDNYSVSGLIRYLIKMFYDDSIIKIFEERGIEIITSRYIKEVLNKTEIEFLEEIEDKKDFIILSSSYGYVRGFPFSSRISITKRCLRYLSMSFTIPLYSSCFV